MRKVIMLLIVLVFFCIPIFSQATTENITNNEITNSQNLTVTNIQITSPNTGTYAEEQTVHICVYFDNKITGTSPTLKIKFGDGDERKIANGTIHNDDVVSTFGQYIEYTYNIQEGDNGHLTTTGLEGGEIKDADGNIAVLTCPELTGSISVNAKTKVKIEETKDTDKEESKEEKKKAKEDKTIATGEKIPYTGLDSRIIAIILLIGIIGIIAKIRYNSYKDV